MQRVGIKYENGICRMHSASGHLIRGFLLRLKTMVVGVVVDVSKPALRALSPPSEGRKGALHVRAHEAEWKAAGRSLFCPGKEQGRVRVRKNP